MVAENKKAVAAGIIAFLNDSIKDGTVSHDDKESVEVAIECIADVFGTSESDASSLLGGQSLLSIVEQHKSGATKKSVPVEVEETTAKAAAGGVSEANKEEAEKLKAEGNKHVAAKAFNEAVEAYTKAIELDPTNAIYFSNRAAAYTSLREPEKAAEDARAALKLDPAYARAYSRLGLALYSMGDAKGALQAYEDGLKAEGANPSPGMQKGYEAAKKRVEEELENAVPSAPAEDTTRSAPGSSASAGGMPDLSSLAGMFGGAGGGAGGKGGFDFASMMNNPMVQQMASKLMSDPNAMSSLQGLMGSGAGKKAKDDLAAGKMPDFSELANDPSIQEMYRKFTGGGSQ